MFKKVGNSIFQYGIPKMTYAKTLMFLSPSTTFFYRIPLYEFIVGYFVFRHFVTAPYQSKAVFRQMRSFEESWLLF